LAAVLLAIGDSIYLADLHHKANTDASFDPSCDISSTFRCTSVAISPYSVFLGVPVAVWGLVTYAIFLFFIIAGLLRRGAARQPWPSGLYWLLSTGTLLVTIALALIAEFWIRALCIGCLMLYVLNALLFAGATWMLIKDKGALARDLQGFPRNPPLIGVAVAALVAGAVLMLTYPPYWELPIQAECDGLMTGVEADGSCWVGAREPQLVIVEFSDYRCPFCLRAHHTLRKLVKEHPDRIRLIHKHFPLDMECNPIVERPFHVGACTMARMAYCASRQGGFWKMNDALFALSRELSADPEAMAFENGLDISSFVDCLDSPDAIEHVQNDIREGIRLQITGTPTFLVDGQMYQGRIPPEVLAPYLR
jgi:uncharacterized membrane protein